MIIFYGQYYVGGKRVACRNDFCETCQDSVVIGNVKSAETTRAGG
jgi:hypothetical protein